MMITTAQKKKKKNKKKKKTTTMTTVALCCLQLWLVVAWVAQEEGFRGETKWATTQEGRQEWRYCYCCC
jgi:hypothetical protein